MNALARRLIPVVLVLLLAGTLLPGVRADDIDVYRNPTLDSLQPPATIISLDLNLLGICDNVLLPPTSALNPSTPSCTDARLGTTLQTLLSPNGQTPTQFLTSLGPAALCALATSLGATLPTVAVPLLGNLTCSTLALLNNPLLGLVLVNSFTSQLVSTILGVLNPLLPTVIGQLPATVTSALNTAIPGLLKVVGAPLALSNLNTLLSGILNNLINSKVAIIVSHNNIGNASANPVPFKPDTASYPNGNRYACDFNDTSTSSSLSTRTRASTGNCSNGAYFLVGFTSLVDSTSVNSVLALVTGQLSGLLDPTTGLLNVNNLSNTLQTTLAGLLGGNTLALTPPYQGKEIYDEIFHYLSGDVVYNAPLKTYDGLFSVLSPASIVSGGRYTATTLNCRTVNVLNIEATNSLYDNDSDLDIATPSYLPGVDLNPAGGSASPPTATGFGNLVSAAQTVGFPSTSPDAARFKLNSFFVVRDNLSSQAALGNAGANLLTYVGALGVFNLGKSISDLLKPVLSIDAALASAVAVDRLDYSKRNVPAFFTEFHPVLGQKPAWPGNLKRLDLRQNSDGSLTYVDATGAAAVDSSDGRIAASAQTIWSTTTDGRITTAGGAGAKVPGYAVAGGGNPGRKNADGQRTLYYDAINATTKVPSLGALDADTSSTAAVTDLVADTGSAAETAASCGAAKTAAQVTQELLLFARGFDTGSSCAGSKGAGSTVVGRSWLLGATLHSRPVPINYGARNGASVTDPDIRVIFGTQDGFLHMVQNGSLAAPSGVENWAFMPRETMINLKTLRDNQFSTQLPYGVDGAPAVLSKSGTDTASKGIPGAVYAYFGMRRGGSKVYALDLTNPDSPKLMWRIGVDGLYSANSSSPGLVSGSAANFAELGLTFSTPSIGKVQLQGETTPRSVVIFGAGYNGGVDASGNRIGKDLNTSRNTSTTTPDSRVGTDDQPVNASGVATGTGRGNALYMVDAVTGELLWKGVYGSALGYAAGSRSFSHPLLVDSIPSEVTLLDTDGDGLSDRLYVGDTGGRVWRADFAGTDRSKWTLSLLASVGRHGANASNSFADDRRFFLPPDYVPARDTVNGVNSDGSGNTTVYSSTAKRTFDAIIIGSGDREDPFNKVTSNAVYTFHDLDTVSGKTLTDTSTADGVISSEGDTRLLTRLNVTDLTTVCANATAGCAASSNLDRGWQLALSTAGEKMASTPVTTASQTAGTLGTIFFNTFVPPNSTSCTQSEGTGRIYAVALGDSRAIYTQFSTGTSLSRSTAARSPGLQGQLSAITTAGVGFNADTLQVVPQAPTTVFWRERRMDQ